jgi:gliding motility-associated-like protein
VKYEKYLWSNNTTLPSVKTGAAGFYTVKVTDVYACEWSESVTVALKDCYQEIYFPTGFTPNKDGLNDVFGPKVFGRLEYFYFTIYNRWGQKNYESNDPLKGWDGTTHKELQNQGTYIWMAEYRFPGQQNKTQKGTVVLLR